MDYNVQTISNTCGVWIVGPPRTGKDHAVLQLKSVYMKPLNKWWDGYSNEENELISDLAPDHGK